MAPLQVPNTGALTAKQKREILSHIQHRSSAFRNHRLFKALPFDVNKLTLRYLRVVVSKEGLMLVARLQANSILFCFLGESGDLAEAG